MIENIEGTRLFAVSNLKKIVEENGLAVISDYLINAPDNVRNTIFSWCDKKIVEEYCSFEMRKKEPVLQDTSPQPENPYQNMNFSKRLVVKELLMYRNDTGKCPVHKIPLVNKQIVVEYAGRKKYGILLPTCKRCKRLFISSSKLDAYESTFKEKGVAYSIFEPDKRN